MLFNTDVVMCLLLIMLACCQRRVCNRKLCICYSVLFSHISSGSRIVTMIPPADYVEKTSQMMDAANVYDCSATVRTGVVIRSCGHRQSLNVLKIHNLYKALCL